MLFSRPSHMGRGIAVGMIIGAMLGAGSMLMTNKELCCNIRKTVKRSGRMLRSMIDRIDL